MNRWLGVYQICDNDYMIYWYKYIRLWIEYIDELNVDVGFKEPDENIGWLLIQCRMGLDLRYWIINHIVR